MVGHPALNPCCYMCTAEAVLLYRPCPCTNPQLVSAFENSLSTKPISSCLLLERTTSSATNNGATCKTACELEANNTCCCCVPDPHASKLPQLVVHQASTQKKKTRRCGQALPARCSRACALALTAEPRQICHPAPLPPTAPGALPLAPVILILVMKRW